MAYSYVEYVGTAGGTTGPFQYGSVVSLLDADTEAISTQLKVYKNGTLLTYTTDYTIDTVNEEISTVAAVYNTDLLRIARETKKDARYVDYVDSTNVTAELLDLDSNQLFFIVQEAFDLQTDAMTRGTDGQWNARGYRIGNVSTAVNGTDAVNLNQLQAAVSGAIPATLSGYGTLVHTGDGVVTDFALPAAISTITSADDVEVYINGLRQRPTTHYTIVSGNVRITPAPSSADTILLAYPEGTVSAILTANSVTTSSIQDDAVTVDKIAQGTNGQFLATVASNTAWTNITASYVSDFDTQVRTNRLNQLTAANGNYSMGSNKITNLANPTTSFDAATKTYVDSYQHTYTSTVSMTGSATSVSATISGLPFSCGCVALNIPLTVPGGATVYLDMTVSFTGDGQSRLIDSATVQGSASYLTTVTRVTSTSITVSSNRTSGTATYQTGTPIVYTVSRGS